MRTPIASTRGDPGDPKLVAFGGGDIAGDDNPARMIERQGVGGISWRITETETGIVATARAEGCIVESIGLQPDDRGMKVGAVGDRPGDDDSSRRSRASALPVASSQPPKGKSVFEKPEIP